MICQDHRFHIRIQALGSQGSHRLVFRPLHFHQTAVQGFAGDSQSRFFQPFLVGIFFDPELKMSSRMFEFVFRMISMGDSALPAGGMGACNSVQTPPRER